MPSFLAKLAQLIVPSKPAVEQSPDLGIHGEEGVRRAVAEAHAAMKQSLLRKQELYGWIEGVAPECVGSLDFVVQQNQLHLFWKARQEAQGVFLLTLPFVPAVEPSACSLEKPKGSPTTQEGSS